MAKKPTVRRKSKARPGKSMPVSFRLDRTLIEQIDGIAERFDVARNNIVALILHEYVKERGDDAVEAMLNREAGNADQLNIFS